MEKVSDFIISIDGLKVPSPYSKNMHSASDQIKGKNFYLHLEFPINHESMAIFKYVKDKVKSRRIFRSKFTVETLYIEDIFNVYIVDYNMALVNATIDQDAWSISILMKEQNRLLSSVG